MNLYAHQREGLDRLSQYTSCAFFWDMGTGKTRTAFVKASEIGTKILIVCPLSVIPQWVEELKSNGHRCDNLRIDAPVNNWGIINYESIWRKEPGWYEDYDTVIIDESQNIGNDRSKRTKYILKYITPNRNVILLSGTPDSGHYENLYTQLKALGWGGTKSKFYNFYVNTAIVEFVPGIKTRKITGYKNVDSLKQLCKNMGCDFLKSSECLELPEQIDIDIKVSKSRDYSRFKKDLIVTVNEEEMVGNSSIAEVIGLRKIASLGKKSAYCDLVKSTDKRLIVFYNFDAELNNLRQWNRLSEKTMYICNGKVKDVDQWKQDESGVLCVQYQAGATGLNLQEADTIIYLSPCYSSALYEQSKKRIHRIGQRQNCKYYKLIMSGTIEEDIYKSLALKKDYSDELFLKNL